MKGFFSFMRRFRIAVAIAVFCLISVQFFDIYHALPKAYYMANPTHTQFAPSLLKMLASTSLLAGAAFFTFTIFAAIFGRAYCSFFCPFGIMMDFVRRAASFPARAKFLKTSAVGKFCARNFSFFKYKKARNILRGTFLAAAALCIGFGYTALFGFMDPYSLYGKIMGDIFQPAAALAVNGTSRILYDFEIYAVPPVNGDPTVPLAAFGAGLLILAAVSLAAAFRGRLFCNTLCPVGAFLGFFSARALFKIRINSEACISCGMCERSCKAECINSKERSVDFSKCVLCFDCASKCVKDAFEFAPNEAVSKFFKKSEAPAAMPQEISLEKCGPADAGRRKFPALLAGVAGMLCMAASNGGKGKGQGGGRGEGRGLGGGGQCAKIRENASSYGVAGEREDKRLSSPPGSASIKNFLERCTGCQICTAACKAQILKPSLGEWGLEGLMQPYMDYSAGFCLYDCHSCSKACPTGAIHFITGKEKHTVKIGTAIFRKSLCVVHTDGTDCAACAEHCPVQAIETIPYGKREDALYIPHVHEDVCIGCGACEYICPVVPQKAIVVQGLAVHEQAVVFNESMRIYKPEEQKTPQKKSETKAPSGDFPF